MKTRPSAFPLYTLAELARYSHGQSQFVRRLFEGCAGAGSQHPPLLTAASVPRGGVPLTSFENLIETALVAALRAKGISLQAIREAHRIAHGEFGEHPFARRPIFVAGADIFMQAEETVADRERQLTALTKGGQRALEPVLKQYLQFVEWEQDWPVEWQPKGGVVRQNPEVEFGLPQVKGVRTEIVRSRFEADEAVAELADDFGLTLADVEQALRYELWLRPAA
jgi:uncharacterized protein (DUF433 family)